MRKQLLILLPAVIFLCSCNRNKTSSGASTDTVTVEAIDHAAEVRKLNALLQQYETPAQKFTVSGRKKSQVTGKHGTCLHINPNTLQTSDGQPAGDKIEVELKELTETRELLRSSVQTVCDGRLLVSGGAYYVNMTSDGKQLQLTREGTTFFQKSHFIFLYCF